MMSQMSLEHQDGEMRSLLMADKQTPKAEFDPEEVDIDKIEEEMMRKY